MIDLLAERISNPGPLLEIVTRQYYEIRRLEDVKIFEQAGGQFVTGNYELAGQQLHLVSTVTDRERLPATLHAVDTIAGPKRGQPRRRHLSVLAGRPDRRRPTVR